MRASIRTLTVGLSIITLSGCATGSRCLHRPCTDQCTASLSSSASFSKTSKSLKPSWFDRSRFGRWWNRDEEARDATLRPESTPIPGARTTQRPGRSGVLDLPAVTREEDEID